MLKLYKKSVKIITNTGMTRNNNYKGGNNMLNHGLLFQVYGEGAAWQFLGWILVFTCLVLANEFARRTKAGGMLCFVVLPIILTVYFIAIYVSAAAGAEWALNNHMYI